eukprot:TRINITY_DN26680_c0_g1_i1.p1 TRINITY_DN26680_c0_g1~~TRINITY_DN26680_c0_g1_i1.p1  ORF type:complete len:290 (-),score=30.83 TRINITY_DN26680_c0_g1_i1:746-1615(-)
MGNSAVREGGSKERGADGRPVPDGSHHSGGHRFQHTNSCEDMGNSPPDSPGSAARSPLMFTPQIPMAPIPKPDEFSLGGYPGPTGMGYPPGGDGGMGEQEQGVATMIAWTHGGTAVSVEGSWDNWTTRQALQRSGKDFTIVKMLPPGIYQYKFIVDDQWRYAPDLPAVYDEMGNVNNVLEVQEYVPENLDNLAGFEPALSPPSSYNNPLPVPEDYAKEPPAVPPHLHLTLLNVPPSIETPTSLPRPQHVILNHLYVEKGKAARSVLALGLTHRFRSKYVTVVLYKPLRK